MGAVFPMVVVGVTVTTTVVLLLLAIAAPSNRSATLLDHDGRPRIRLHSRLLFTRTEDDAITIDCLLLSVTLAAGPGIFAPEGLPFTLQLRAPSTIWFADRVERLLEKWAAESRELVVELREDHGTVRTMLSSGESAVHLELAGAAGLSLSS